MQSRADEFRRVSERLIAVEVVLRLIQVERFTQRIEIRLCLLHLPVEDLIAVVSNCSAVVCCSSVSAPASLFSIAAWRADP